MKVYFLDTSALVKRYHQERGSQVIDAVFAEQDDRSSFLTSASSS